MKTLSDLQPDRSDALSERMDFGGNSSPQYENEPMSVTIDPRIAELLISRLCHDLVGPVGAVNNGLEFLAEDDEGMSADALTLAMRSAGQAADLLQFYRLAYGAAGAQGADWETLTKLCEGYGKAHKIEVVWPQSVPAMLPDGCAKVLLNMVALGAECLMRGGKLIVSLSPGTGGFEVRVAAEGEDARLRDEASQGLADAVDVAEMSPRSVHAYFTRLMARTRGGDLQVSVKSERQIDLLATLPF